MITKNIDVINFVDRICGMYNHPNRFGYMSNLFQSMQKDYVLLVSDSGMAMLKAKDCYVKGSVENWEFKDYKDHEDVKMFLIEIGETDDERVIGDVAKVEYDQFYSLVTQNEQPLQKIVLSKNGELITYSCSDIELTDLARFDVVENISGNDGGINAAIDYINGLINAQLQTVDEKTFFSSLEVSIGSKAKIAVVIIKPKGPPYVDHIVGDITSFQQAVDGLIRAIPHALDDESIIICNDSDKRYSYVQNRRINGEMIHGTIVIAGFNNETGEFKSLTQDQQKKYVEMYRDRDRSDGSSEIPR